MVNKQDYQSSCIYCYIYNHLTEKGGDCEAFGLPEVCRDEFLKDKHVLLEGHLK